jgi:16S rRNA (cytosine967-C5)-methyltransferase
LPADKVVNGRPLDRPRERALAILCESERGAFASPLIEQARSEFDARDSAFILELVYGVLRNRLRIDWFLDRYSTKAVSSTDGHTRNILRLGAYQLLFLDKVPASAAVNTATELAKRHGKKQGYVNGVLRNLERNKDVLTLPSSHDAATRLSLLYSHPEWLVRRWTNRIGVERTEEVLRNNNKPAPLVVRTNTLKGTREELVHLLGSQGTSVRRSTFSPSGIEILSSPGMTTLPAFREGRFLVQDEAAQLVGFILSPQPGEAVLDACAAPGGKATHLAELMGNRGTIVALDDDRARIPRIVANCGRLGISIVKAATGDASAFREGSYDRVLIDAPCSGLGVLRRHPDGRWTKQERTIRERTALQAKILENCAQLLKPGGALVYATCTTEPEENEEVIDRFRDSVKGKFTIDDPRPLLPGPAVELVDDKGFFRTFPGHPDLDGFFAVRMVRTA